MFKVNIHEEDFFSVVAAKNGTFSTLDWNFNFVKQQTAPASFRSGGVKMEFTRLELKRCWGFKRGNEKKRKIFNETFSRCYWFFKRETKAEEKFVEKTGVIFHSHLPFSLITLNYSKKIKEFSFFSGRLVSQTESCLWKERFGVEKKV